MIQCFSMDHDTKTAIETLTKTVRDGFAAVAKRFAAVEERMETGFAAVEKRFAAVEEHMDKGFASLEVRMEKGFGAVAEDLADIKDRLSSVESKIAGTNRRLDDEAMLRTDLALPKRVSDLEEKAFGASRHPQHLPLK